MSWLDTLEQVRTRDYKKAKLEDREQACRDIVNTCSYAAAFVAVMPLPFTDVLLTLPIQSGMVLTVGHIHGRKLSGAQSKDLAVELGTLAGASLLARQGIKLLIPVFGAVMTVPAAFAANWAIGRVAMEYFKNPEVSKARLKQLYADAVREGKARFSREEFERFRKEKGNEAAVKKVVKPKGKAAAKGKKTAVSKSKKARGPTVESILEEDLPRRIAAREELAKAVGKVIHVELSGPGGGNWTLDLASQPPKVKKGLHGSPAMTARTTAAHFVKLGSGALDPAAAMMDGALTLEPLDLELAQAFGRLIA